MIRVGGALVIAVAVAACSSAGTSAADLAIPGPFACLLTLSGDASGSFGCRAALCNGNVLLLDGDAIGARLVAPTGIFGGPEYTGATLTSFDVGVTSQGVSFAASSALSVGDLDVHVASFGPKLWPCDDPYFPTPPVGDYASGTIRADLVEVDTVDGGAIQIGPRHATLNGTF